MRSPIWVGANSTDTAYPDETIVTFNTMVEYTNLGNRRALVGDHIRPPSTRWIVCGGYIFVQINVWTAKAQAR